MPSCLAVPTLALVATEVEARGLEVPDGAMEITAAVGIAADGSLDPTATVYRLLWLPRPRPRSASHPKIQERAVPGSIRPAAAART